MLAENDHQPALNTFVESHAGLEGQELVSSVIRAAPGKVALMSSFGAESAVLLHMVSVVDRHLPVLFLDTAKLFPETIEYAATLVRLLKLSNVRHIVPDGRDLAVHDPDGTLHLYDKDLCCHYRKTAPMRLAQTPFEVLISGRKRYHGSTRASLDFVSLQDGKVKVEPLAAFSALDIRAYMDTHGLPQHPLSSAGYRSIGCAPCTVAGGTDTDPRAGRWAGTEKTECGIHFSANGTVIRTELRQAANA